MDKKQLLTDLKTVDETIADKAMARIAKVSYIEHYNKQNPNDKYIQNDVFYPTSKTAKERFNRFATRTINLDPIKRITNFHEPVLLRGATGTGKELLAQALHGDRTGKFVTVNCAAMTETLLDSELFGHIKGAFTGADSTNIGLFATAKDGTVFIDELCAASKHMQTKLLRVIEYGTFRSVGNNTESRTNCRIVFATSGDINTLLPDLVGRIPFDFTIPPLAERLDDIPEILDAINPDGTFPRDFVWQAHMLPYNVRSLKRAVLRHLFYEELPA